MKRLAIITVLLLCVVASHAQAKYYPPGEEPERHCYAVTHAVGSKPIEVKCEELEELPPAPEEEVVQPCPVEEAPVIVKRHRRFQHSYTIRYHSKGV